MRSTASVVALTLVAAAILVAAGVLLIVYTGAYNVAATQPHTAFGRWLLQTSMENSVRRRAHAGVASPPASPEDLRRGAQSYGEMCVVCHGAPGVERGVFGKGITPTPPDLAKVASQWDERELHWIVKHGVKLAGMPAFGATHKDDELWQIVRFVRELPQMTAVEYRRLAGDRSAEGRQGSEGRDGHGHEHGKAAGSGAQEG